MLWKDRLRSQFFLICLAISFCTYISNMSAYFVFGSLTHFEVARTNTTSSKFVFIFQDRVIVVKGRSYINVD